MIHRQYQGLLLPEIQESSAQFVMISVMGKDQSGIHFKAFPNSR